MASFNKVMLMGNLTRDPEIRYTPKGTAVTDLGLAVNRKYRVDDEMREEVTFVDITFWGRKAEVIAQYMKKGGGILIEGRLQMDSWDDRTTGKKRYQLKVIGDTFEFVGSYGGGGGGGGGNYSSSSDSNSGSGSQSPESYSATDDSQDAPAPQSFPPDLDDDADQIPF